MVNVKYHDHMDTLSIVSMAEDFMFQLIFFSSTYVLNLEYDFNAMQFTSGTESG